MHVEIPDDQCELPASTLQSRFGSCDVVTRGRELSVEPLPFDARFVVGLGRALHPRSFAIELRAERSDRLRVRRSGHTDGSRQDGRRQAQLRKQSHESCPCPERGATHQTGQTG